MLFRAAPEAAPLPIHALDRAPVAERAATVKLLLERGAKHARALTMAAASGDIDTVQIFLERGSKDLDSAWLAANQFGNAEIKALIDARRKIRDVGPEGLPKKRDRK